MFRKPEAEPAPSEPVAAPETVGSEDAESDQSRRRRRSYLVQSPSSEDAADEAPEQGEEPEIAEAEDGFSPGETGDPDGKQVAEAGPATPEVVATRQPDDDTVPRLPERAQIFHVSEPPRTMAETRLSESFLLNLVAKVMQSGGTMTPAEISDIIKLPKVVCREIITAMTRLMLVEAQGLESKDIKSDIRYSLSDLGKKWALDALNVSQYIGPAPVTLDQFEAQIRRQSINHEEVHRHELDEAFSHLIIPDILKAQLGPAVNSGRSMLLYGEPGNGKTSLAEALGTTFVDVIFLPYAIMVANQIIRFFDETLHEPVDLPDGSPEMDARWVACKRPVVIAGGELTLPMLDLSFEHTARFYEAPMHLKALGGIFVLDDFGRQAEEPQAYLNRWIVPLEKGFDIMSLHTGKKFTVPFDQLVVFSSNMMPEDMGDDAALRRIYFKIHVHSPSRDDYMQIFKDVCEATGLPWNQDVMDRFYQDKYEEKGFVTSGAHPGFLVRHIFAACRYLDRKPELSIELLDLAWRNVAASRKRGIRA